MRGVPKPRNLDRRKKSKPYSSFKDKLLRPIKKAGRDLRNFVQGKNKQSTAYGNLSPTSSLAGSYENNAYEETLGIQLRQGDTQGYQSTEVGAHVDGERSQQYSLEDAKQMVSQGIAMMQEGNWIFQRGLMVLQQQDAIENSHKFSVQPASISSEGSSNEDLHYSKEVSQASNPASVERAVHDSPLQMQTMGRRQPYVENWQTSADVPPCGHLGACACYQPLPQMFD